MHPFSLNRLIQNLSEVITNMEMKGFDALCDSSWTGNGDFNIEFSDCFVPVICSIENTFIIGVKHESRVVTIDKIWKQLPDDEKHFTVKEIKIIEESLKL